ncbi:cytochrome c [Devosia sp.]|uniref:c-type cytochrome n=1 Tax=Devosia sp. TaxID=1871048 RepID=UPI001B1F49C8|nr:cytochrome c [Devosia sp.]MBO9588977.1 cytochrome c [Devosia sp.]
MKTYQRLAVVLATLLAPALPGFAEDTAPSTPTSLAETIVLGEPIYVRRCQECHGAKGGGFVGPKLSGNQRLANAEFVIRQITNGSADMPAFGKRLTPEELLAVGTYVRNSWDNSFGAFTE